MEVILIIVAVFLATVIGTVVANILVKKKSQKDDKNLEAKFAQLSQDALRMNSEQFLTLSKEVLGAQKTEIKTDLEGKKSAINQLISEIRTDIKKNEERLTKSDDDRVRSFSQLKTELDKSNKLSEDLKTSTDKLKSLLSNNQMRGAFGEQVAEDLLKMAGFVLGQNYNKNTAQDTKATRPDFTIFLPDQTKINVDVKFPYTSLVKYTEAENKDDQERHMRQFKQDVKNKIKQISTRDYINPEEKTVDFVILFIPNEMIFSFVYDKMNEVWEESMKTKVVCAGPFSFTAILRMVKQAYTNFRYQKDLHNIIGLIHKFDDEYQKYSQSVDLLGDRIKSASKQYDSVSSTRDRQLTKIVDKIKSQDAIESEKKEHIDLVK